MDSYLLRHNVCGKSKNLNKAIPTIIAQVNKERYAKSIEVATMKKSGNDKFPRDPTFKEKLKQSHLYEATPICKYILERLERHYEGKESVELSDLEIEHVMPQKISDGWKKALGDKHAEVHDKYLHTIGNLTFTAHNQDNCTLNCMQ